MPGRIHLLYWPAALAFVGCGSATLLIAWDDVRSQVVLAIQVLLWGVVVIGLAVIGVLAGAWTTWRIAETQTALRIQSSAEEFARTVGGQIQIANPRVADQWVRAYASLGWLGYSMRTLAVARLKPYFAANGERYLKHMVGQMKEHHYAALVTEQGAGGRPYRVTRFIGAYQAFWRNLVHGRLRLAPHPTLPPPVITIRPREVETMEITETTDTTEIT